MTVCLHCRKVKGHNKPRGNLCCVFEPLTRRGRAACLRNGSSVVAGMLLQMEGQAC